jgi:hypothetical protein
LTATPGTNVMILKIFSPKNSAKILAVFFAQTTASFCKNLIITLVFEKNANFLPKIAENVIITSTPGWPDEFLNKIPKT